MSVKLKTYPFSSECPKCSFINFIRKDLIF